MDSRFLLPASVAAALHTLVLFGFRTTFVPSGKPPVEPASRAAFRPISLEAVDEPAPQAAEADAPKPKGSPESLRPTLDDDSLTKSALLEMPRVERRRNVEVHPARIEAGSWGMPDGIGDGSEGDHSILSARWLDNEPRTRVRVPPVYPTEARNGGLSGEVVVEFVVDESGRVSQAKVVRSSDRVFEAASLQAVEKWRFEPGRKNNRPVCFRMVVPMVFSLEN